MPKDQKPTVPEFDVEKNIRPARGYYLILEQEEPTGFTILTPDQSRDQAQFGRIVAVGMEVIKDGQWIEPEAKVGDYIYFLKWKGLEIERGRGKDRKKYKLVEFHYLAGIVNF